MIILGKNTDDRGTQLEQLTMRLLSQRGYRNLTRSWVGAGGEEIDVDGEYCVPGLVAARADRVICECKAHKTAIDLPAWMKFLGKLYTAEKTRSEPVLGCFMALSGVNGNVKGNYDALKESHARIELVHGDDLLDVLTVHLKLASFKQVRELVSGQTRRTSKSEEVAYYDGRLYWIIIFEHEVYTVLSAAGASIDAGEGEALRAMIEPALPAHVFVDLIAEDKAKKRAINIDSFIISQMMINGGSAELAEMSQPPGQTCALPELEARATRLLEDGLIRGDAKGTLSLPASKDGAAIDQIGQVFLRLLDGGIPSNVFESVWYEENIDEALLRYILHVQGDLSLVPEDMPRALRILRYSPSALKTFLRPSEMLIHRGQEVGKRTPEMMQMDQEFFKQRLCEQLHSDYRTRELYDYFFRYRQLKELDVEHTFKVKLVPQDMIQVDVRERLRIVPVSESEGGGLLLIRLRNDLAEPWDPISDPGRAENDSNRSAPQESPGTTARRSPRKSRRDPSRPSGQ